MFFIGTLGVGSMANIGGAANAPVAAAAWFTGPVMMQIAAGAG